MSSVAKVDSALGRALVGTVLQRDDGLAGPQLLVRELALVLVRLLRSNRGLAVLAGLAAERLQADDHRVEVLSLPEVHGLEGFLWWHTELLRTLQEGRDVLHALERHLAGVDLLHRTGLDRVRQVTQENAVLENFVEVVHLPGCVDRFAGDLLDPFQTLGGQFFAVLGVDLSLGLGGESGFRGTVGRHGVKVEFFKVVLNLKISHSCVCVKLSFKLNLKM